MNTTEHLLADMERLREHLGIERWLLFGGSWGSTLVLAYAERHPERVSEIVIAGVTTHPPRPRSTGSTGASAGSSPRQWERFRAGVPEADRDGDLLAAYARLMEHPGPGRAREGRGRLVRLGGRGHLAWNRNGAPNAYSDRPPAAQLALVRICAHYFSHGAWLEEGALLRDADRLAGIPGVLIHGRLDLGGPLGTAWELARAWPDARLVVDRRLRAHRKPGHERRDPRRA